MEAYVPADVTAQAQAISRRHAGPGETLPRHTEYGAITPRCLLTGGRGLLAAGARCCDWGATCQPSGTQQLVPASGTLAPVQAPACCPTSRPLLLPFTQTLTSADMIQNKALMPCVCVVCWAVHSRPAAAHHGGRELRVKTRTLACIQLDQDELDLRWALPLLLLCMLCFCCCCCRRRR